MATLRNSTETVYTSVGLTGSAETVSTVAIKVLLVDANGDALLATGLTVPSDTASGYAKGCLFIDTDVASGTTGLNCNKGTNTSCVFSAVTQA